MLRGYRVQHELSDYLLHLRAENENDLEQMHSIQSIGHIVRSCDTLPKVSEILAKRSSSTNPSLVPGDFRYCIIISRVSRGVARLLCVLAPLGNKSKAPETVISLAKSITYGRRLLGIRSKPPMSAVPTSRSRRVHNRRLLCVQNHGSTESPDQPPWPAKFQESRRH